MPKRRIWPARRASASAVGERGVGTHSSSGAVSALVSRGGGVKAKGAREAGGAGSASKGAADASTVGASEEEIDGGAISRGSGGGGGLAFEAGGGEACPRSINKRAIAKPQIPTRAARSVRFKL